MQRNRGKQESGKDQISSRKLEIPRDISCKDGLNKGQKWYGPNRSKKGDVTTDSMGVKNILNNSRLFENLEF